MSARLHRALSRDPKIKLVSLVAPLGMCMQSEGEILELLLTTHFPNLEVTEEMAAPAAACGAMWGLRHTVVHWLHVSIIWLSITFASLVWYPGCQTASAQK
jgi:hypothetical protein